MALYKPLFPFSFNTNRRRALILLFLLYPRQFSIYFLSVGSDFYLYVTPFIVNGISMLLSYTRNYLRALTLLNMCLLHRNNYESTSCFNFFRASKTLSL